MLELAINHRRNLSGVLKISTAEASEGELAAMVSFAIAFPNGFMALVDTYDTKRFNFIAFSAFVTFFPQLVAGPIERATNLLPQFYNKRI